MDIRQKRKWDHLKYSLETQPGPLVTGFDDLHLVHQALGMYNLDEIDCSVQLVEKDLSFPLIINAMTGGARGLDKLNEKLAIVARECNVGLAVGSQTAGIKNPDIKHTYDIVRKINPQGLIFANVSGLESPDIALKAIDMIDADGIQLHLNMAQELAMDEGDRKFETLINNIKIIEEKSKVPVIIKEVGFGLSMETVGQLKNIGIKYFDIGGAGGANFVAIETRRSENFNNVDLINWGIPTAISLIETLTVSDEINVFSTGGIRSASDILKSLVLGAKAVGMATPLLEKIYDDNEKELIIYLNKLFNQVKTLMLLSGVNNLNDLKKCPIIITGFVKEWLESRGININEYARRKLY